jgi:hypothetical protein
MERRNLWAMIVAGVVGAIVAGSWSSKHGKHVVEPPTVTAPARAEADKAAIAFAAALGTCSSEVDGMLDLRTMFLLGLVGQELDDGTLDGIMHGATTTPLSEKLCGQPATQGAVYKRIDVASGSGVREVIRAIMTDGSVNYIEPRFGVVGDGGEVKVVDIYSYVLGDTMSHLLGELAKRALPDMSNSELADAGAAMQKLSEAANSGDIAGMKAQLAKLPPTLQRLQLIRRFVVQALVNGADPDASAEVESYAKAFPNDPSVDMLADVYLTKNDYASARASIDRLDKRVGGDPYLDVIRARISVAAGDPARAVKEAISAQNREPTLREAWYAGAEADAAANDFTGAVVALDQLTKRFHIAHPEAQLTDTPAVRALVDSAEFTAWSAAQPTP